MNSAVLHASPWKVLRSGKEDPFWNMALDEALLEYSAFIGQPVLRFYGWSPAAATFGYFQHYAEVAAWTDLRPLIRRPTGGGLVRHDRDWTYSVAIPPGHGWTRLKAAESYELLHEWVRTAFEHIGIETTLAPAPVNEGPGQCFVGAEKCDLLRNGLKIAGAAQRRNKHGLLIQGSIQNTPPGVKGEDWEQALAQAAGGATALELPLGICARADALAAEKYSRNAYNERR